MEYEAFSCPCGMNFQYTDIDTILEVSADIGGDLQYLDLSLEAEVPDNDLPVRAGRPATWSSEPYE